MYEGRLIVVSAPSGAGKGTLLERVRREFPNLGVTVSATTRRPRPGETDGVEYHFLSRDQFEAQIKADAFVEWAEVHGQLYGTLKTELDRHLAKGETVIFELDVQGMRSLKRLCRQAISIFIAPPSLEELERRIIARGVNDGADMAVRLRNAAVEMAAQHECDYVVVNDNLEQAAKELAAIIGRDDKP